MIKDESLRGKEATQCIELTIKELVNKMGDARTHINGCGDGVIRWGCADE